MDYYRFGCAGIGGPGGMTLIGLMGALTAPDGAAPDTLLLVNGQMEAGRCPAPTVVPCGALVHILTGAATAIVADESVRLIADNTVRIPQDTPFQFSTRETLGMTALVIMPLREGTSGAADDDTLTACFADVLSLPGEPRRMAIGSLDILGELRYLTTDGCTLSTVQMTRGSFHRDGIVASLLPRYAGDPRALRAFVWACNAHPAAPWWQDRTRAQTAIAEGVTKLLTS